MVSLKSLSLIFPEIWLLFQDREGQALRDPMPHSLRGALRRQGWGGRHDQEPGKCRRRRPRGALQEYLDVRRMKERLEKSKCCQIYLYEDYLI